MRNRMKPTINAGTMADVAFLLLLFFLVATSIENPKGIQVLLPKFEPTPPIQLPENSVLTVKINKANQVMVELEYSPIEQVSDRVAKHVLERIEMDEQPIVSLVTDTAAIYNTYIEVYDQIKSAYTTLRNDFSQSMYGKDFQYLGQPERKVVIKKIPMIISEADYY